jgi:hypothetical protein
MVHVESSGGSLKNAEIFLKRRDTQAVRTTPHSPHKLRKKIHFGTE